MAEMEAVAMNRQFWICGFVLFGGMLLNAQDVSPVTRENLEGALGNRSVLLVELVRQAEAGDNYAQYCGPTTYITGRGVLKNDAEVVRACRLTTLGRQIYTAKPRPKVWHELETS